jgi:hypothetical protein
VPSSALAAEEAVQGSDPGDALVFDPVDPLSEGVHRHASHLGEGRNDRTAFHDEHGVELASGWSERFRPIQWNDDPRSKATEAVCLEVLEIRDPAGAPR